MVSTTTSPAGFPEGARRAAPDAAAAVAGRGAVGARARRGESGIGTLEWLMIVGAVAGLAALAVVLVGRLVDDTAEQVGEGGATANRSAAEAAALQITEAAKAEDNADGGRFATWNDWDRYYTARCSRLEVLYSNIGVKMESEFGGPTGSEGREAREEQQGQGAAEGCQRHAPRRRQAPGQVRLGAVTQGSGG